MQCSMAGNLEGDGSRLSTFACKGRVAVRCREPTSSENTAKHSERRAYIAPASRGFDSLTVDADYFESVASP